MQKTDAFVHPGLFFSKKDIASIKDRVSKVAIVKQAYEVLMKDIPTTYHPKPHAVMDMGNTWGANTAQQATTDLLDDGPQAYRHALAYMFTGDERYASNALSIVKAWSTVNTKACGLGMPLYFAWSQPCFTRAMELLKYTYPKYNVNGVPVEKAYLHWLDEVVMENLTHKLSFVNNWLVSMTEARIQIAIFRDDLHSFNDAIDAFRTFLPQVIEGSGLPQEVHRDLCHTQFTLGSLVAIAQLAANQGVDIYMESGGLLLKALETTASILLGEKPSVVNGIELKQVSFHPANWDAAYAHYVNIEHKPMPKTALLLGKHRPEWTLWNWGGTTLTNYMGP